MVRFNRVDDEIEIPLLNNPNHAAKMTKSYVKCLIALLVSQTVKKANVDPTTIWQHTMIERLFNICIEMSQPFLGEVSSNITEKYDLLTKQLFRDLIQEFGSERQVLYAMMSQNLEKEMCISYHIVNNLMLVRRPTFRDKIKTCLKKHWPYIVVTAGAVSAALLVYKSW